MALIFKDARADPPLTVVAVPPDDDPHVGQENWTPKVEGVATIGEAAVTLVPMYEPRSVEESAIADPVGLHEGTKTCPLVVGLATKADVFAAL
jgi:hypothetical protein